jgi:hypothetical protein
MYTCNKTVYICTRSCGLGCEIMKVHKVRNVFNSLHDNLSYHIMKHVNRSVLKIYKIANFVYN